MLERSVNSGKMLVDPATEKHSKLQQQRLYMTRHTRIQMCIAIDCYTQCTGICFRLFRERSLWNNYFYGLLPDRVGPQLRLLLLLADCMQVYEVVKSKVETEFEKTDGRAARGTRPSHSAAYGIRSSSSSVTTAKSLLCIFFAG